mmetsp:Transcript_61861/g.201823  ORF Transcript_61861/g.201823 Transcript_61861/m.201823 type:complete len:206 (+) Transcript_61861:466-1083(+)
MHAQAEVDRWKPGGVGQPRGQLPAFRNWLLRWLLPAVSGRHALARGHARGGGQGHGLVPEEHVLQRLELRVEGHRHGIAGLLAVSPRPAPPSSAAASADEPWGGSQNRRGLPRAGGDCRRPRLRLRAQPRLPQRQPAGAGVGMRPRSRRLPCSTPRGLPGLGPAHLRGLPERLHLRRRTAPSSASPDAVRRRAGRPVLFARGRRA